MATGPERLEVLNRLGIVKGAARDEVFTTSGSLAESSTVSIDDALRSFPAESSSLNRGLKALADSPAVLFIIVCAVTAVGAFLIFRLTASPAQETEMPVATAVDIPLDAKNTTAAKPVARTVSAVNARGVSTSRAASSLPVTSNARRVTAGRDVNPGASPTVAPRQEAITASEPLVPDATPAVLASPADEAAAFVDQAIYTRDDQDVRPPRLLSEPLPAPTIGGWMTRSNVIELLVSDSGAVEHARFLTTPQRMPDMLVLSRAKMWRFTPAVKDGRPVRYRLVLTWEVNP